MGFRCIIILILRSGRQRNVFYLDVLVVCEHLHKHRETLLTQGRLVPNDGAHNRLPAGPERSARLRLSRESHVRSRL